MTFRIIEVPPDKIGDCILNAFKFNFVSSPITFEIVFSKIFAAVILALSDLAPVITIFPVEKIKPVVLGSLMRITTAENLLGLYSAFLHH